MQKWRKHTTHVQASTDLRRKSFKYRKCSLNIFCRCFLSHSLLKCLCKMRIYNQDKPYHVLCIPGTGLLRCHSFYHQLPLSFLFSQILEPAHTQLLKYIGQIISVLKSQAGQLSNRVLAQGLRSLRFKPLTRHPVVEVSSSPTSSSCYSYHIMLRRPAKQGAKFTTESTNKVYTNRKE